MASSITDLSIIIPAYNEEGRIVPTLKDIRNFIKESSLKAEVIVVDDGSTDQTVEVVSKVMEKFPELKLISYSPNRGKGYAVKTGVLTATQGRSKHILFMDADNSTNIREYMRAKKLMKKDTIVIGSRYNPESKIDQKQGTLRHAISRAGNLLIKTVIGTNLHDTQCGFKVFTREQAKVIFSQLKTERFGFDIEIIVLARKLGYKVVELPVTWVNDADSRVHPVWGTLNTLKELLMIRFGR